MDKQTYFKKLSRQVFWRLPQTEAEEVLGDYREILVQRPVEEGASLVEELGTPLQAARLVADPKPYRRWLTAFGVMAGCLLIPLLLLLRTNFYRYPIGLMAVLFALGMAVCLLWFRPRRKAGREPFPRGLLALLAWSFVLLAAAAAVTASIAAGAWKTLPLEWYGRSIQAVLWCLGGAATAVGLLGLVKARVADRRWRALYVLALTVLVECVLITAILHSLDGSVTGWWRAYAIQLGAIGAAGLAGTGAGLC